MTAYDRLLDRLRELGKTVWSDKPNHAMAQCPAHEDRSPSLSITRIEGQVLVHDHGGCEVDDVLASIGWAKADLFDEKRTTYIYDDGRKVHRRYDRNGRKRFSQDANGQKPTLYRLGKIEAAKAADEPILFVEGEKDVHAIESIGGVATTAPQGAGNVDKCDLSPLYGAQVIAIVDDDDQGTKWAQMVRRALTDKAASIDFTKAKTGKDAAEHIAAGYSLAELVPWWPPENDDHPEEDRHLVLTRASDIKPRPVYWLWEARLALGTLALLAGREGVGKSIIAYTIAAMITQGILPGRYFGTPKSVLVAAAEDSWEQTIVPRLIAAGADLNRVFRVEIEIDGIHDELTLPRDLGRVRRAAREMDAVLLILDPLISRLDDRLDTHKDADVRRALEPLVAMANSISIAVWGLIHHNKSGSTDPLQVVMASKAFTAVARSVHTVISDPDDDSDQRRLFGTPKNNLGRTDLPTLSFTIESFAVAIDGIDDLAWTGRLVWGDDSPSSIFEALRRSTQSADEKSATIEAAEWLEDYLTSKGGVAPSADIRKHGAAAGHSYDSLKRAKRKIGAGHESTGFPRRTYWLHPSESKIALQSEQQLEQNPWGDSPTALTALTETQNPQSEQSEQSEQDGGRPALPLDDRPVLTLIDGEGVVSSAERLVAKADFLSWMANLSPEIKRSTIKDIDEAERRLRPANPSLN